MAQLTIVDELNSTKSKVIAPPEVVDPPDIPNPPYDPPYTGDSGFYVNQQSCLDTGYVYDYLGTDFSTYERFKLSNGKPARIINKDHIRDVDSTGYRWITNASTRYFDQNQEIFEIKKGTAASFHRQLLYSTYAKNGTITRTDNALTFTYRIGVTSETMTNTFYKKDFVDGVIPTKIIAVLQGAGGSGGGNGGGGGGSGSFWVGVIDLTYAIGSTSRTWHFTVGTGGDSVSGSVDGNYGGETSLYHEANNGKIYAIKCGGGYGGKHGGAIGAAGGIVNIPTDSTLLTGIYTVYSENGVAAREWGGNGGTNLASTKVYLCDKNALYANNPANYLQLDSHTYGKGYSSNGGSGGSPSHFGNGGEGGTGWGGSDASGKEGEPGAGGGGVGDSATAMSGEGGNGAILFYY